MADRDFRFLLHIWHDELGSLHASLRNVADGELKLFTGLEDLNAYLQASTGGIDTVQEMRDASSTRGG